LRDRSSAPGCCKRRIGAERVTEITRLWQQICCQRRCDTQTALRLMRKLLKKQGFAPKLLVTDKLSYGSAFRQL
jgi:transposase-like protein